MKYSRILSIFLALLVLASGSAALQAQVDFSATSQNEDITQTDFRPDSSIFDFTFSALNPEYTEGPYTPGEDTDIYFYVETTMTEDANTDSLTRIVEFYRCNDSNCDDPTQDQFLEADRQPLNLNSDFTLSEGQDPNWNVEYPVPDEEGYYGAVAYMYDTDTERIVSETPEYQFTVGSPDDSNTEPEPEPEANLELTSTPSFNVNDESNSVIGSLEITNNGDGDMSGSDIVEMQVRPYGSNPLSFTSSQRTCDSSYPNNVHKEYSLDSGDSREISLNAGTNMGDGESYTVYFLTRSDCGGEKVEPIYNSYNAGTFTFDEEQVSDPGPSEQDVIQVSKPKLSYDSKTGTISTQISFKNQGASMDSSDIVEMQVRPEGTLPLVFSDSQMVCDSSRPENVHKEYSLDSGETDSTVLSTDAVSEPGSYTVYLLTREDCGGDKVDPYYNSVQAGTVTIQEDDGSVDPSQGVQWQVLLMAGALGLIGVVANRRF